MKKKEGGPFISATKKIPTALGPRACLPLGERGHGVGCEGGATLSVSPHGLPAPPEGEPR